jgi:hypothetical protein
LNSQPDWSTPSPSRAKSRPKSSALAQHSHALVHHSQGETPQDLVDINEKMEELFEDRFGMPLADAMGHDH